MQKKKHFTEEEISGILDDSIESLITHLTLVASLRDPTMAPDRQRAAARLDAINKQLAKVRGRAVLSPDDTAVCAFIRAMRDIYASVRKSTGSKRAQEPSERRNIITRYIVCYARLSRESAEEYAELLDLTSDEIVHVGERTGRKGGPVEAAVWAASVVFDTQVCAKNAWARAKTLAQRPDRWRWGIPSLDHSSRAALMAAFQALGFAPEASAVGARLALDLLVLIEDLSQGEARTFASKIVWAAAQILHPPTLEEEASLRELGLRL